jgi:16S rRNA processing protein RimM
MVRRPVDPAAKHPASAAGSPARDARPADHVVIAVVGAPHGLKGEVRIKSYTADPMALGDYGPLLGANGQSYRVKVLRPVKDDLVIARLEGINDRTAAESLTNLQLSLSRSQLPAVEDEDEFYHADLIGLAVIDEDGQEIGHVVGLMNFGAGDMLDIRLKRPGPTALLPFTKAFVPRVDLDNQSIHVRTPADFGQDSPPPASGRRKP